MQASTTRTIAFQSGSAATASTAAPSGLRAGDVVISYLGDRLHLRGALPKLPPRCSTRCAVPLGWLRA